MNLELLPSSLNEDFKHPQNGNHNELPDTFFETVTFFNVFMNNRNCPMCMLDIPKTRTILVFHELKSFHLVEFFVVFPNLYNILTFS